MPSTPTQLYTVPEISCDHCKHAIETEVAKVPGVADVTVDVATKTVRVLSTAPDAALRAAIEEAGYDEIIAAPT